MRRLLSMLSLTLLVSGCAASAEDETDSTEDAFSAGQMLTEAACRKPNLSTKKDKPGSAVTSINGCIVGKRGETGKDVTARLVELLGDTDHISRVKSGDDKVFSKFKALPPSGSLETELVQEVDVTLKMIASPSARLRITRTLGADGVYSLRITNITAFKAVLLVLPVTAIQPGDFTLDVKMKPEANGLSISGTGAVELQVMEDQAATASELVRDVFAWLADELND